MASDSIRAAARAASSPRILAWILALSGWGWSAAVYIARTPTRADITAAEARCTEASKSQDAALNARLLDVERKQLDDRQNTALAVRALVGQVARAKAHGSRSVILEREEKAAEARFDTSLRELGSAAAAARAALQ